MQQVTKVKIFLSSPGDVGAERKKAKAVIAQLHRIFSDALNISLEALDWKTHITPNMGRPQEIINQQINDYDIFVGIMWKKFGSPTGVAESGTEEEFNFAYNNWKKYKRPHILFYFSQVPYAPKTKEEIEQWGKVLKFKEKLQKKGLPREYSTVEEFGDLLREHLSKILQNWFGEKGEELGVKNFNHYLSYLEKDTKYIDIRGLITGEGKVHRFEISELYIPLKMAGGSIAGFDGGKREKEFDPHSMVDRKALLQEALRQKKLIIKGKPGAGKTTFLRLLAYSLSLFWLGKERKGAAKELIWQEAAPLPILVRLGLLSEHIRETKENKELGLTRRDDSPEWLLHFLEHQSKEFNWKLTADDFRKELEDGNCLILLDGLDEAPDPVTRKNISSLSEKLLNTYSKCQIVLTSRPAALQSDDVPPDFDIVEIADLEEPEMLAFLDKWCKALFAEDSKKAKEFRDDLSRALRSRAEIRRMARTPVMLTALAVVQWNEMTLPEQRAELYESIIGWLLKSREQKPGRLKSDRCRRLLQKLALAMFIHSDGRQRQVGFAWAAEILADEFEDDENYSKRQKAENFLRQEVVDSGIIVERGNRLEFWHLSFQEYLAACEVGGMLEENQKKLLFEKDRIYSSEWHELVLLLGGVLYKQGLDKINFLIDAIIERAPQDVSPKNLTETAKTVALLGGIVNDLAPFDFKPADPRYEKIVRSVMGIFDKKTFRKISVKTRIEAADALARVGDPRLENDPMVYIRGGDFWMGAQKKYKNERNFDPGADDSNDWKEFPVHQVELSPFYISKYPITVCQFKKFIDENGYQRKEFWEAGGFGKYESPENWEEQLEHPSRPVVYVSWYEAAAYAKWAGGTLPTEAQWERAARGEEYRKYPWGNKEPDSETANFNKSRIGHATPVGIFPENESPEGVIDLAGNVWEWCWDWFDSDYYEFCHRNGKVKDPMGPDKGGSRVVRGGSFVNNWSNMRCANRFWYNPYDREFNLGFRLVRRA